MCAHMPHPTHEARVKLSSFCAYARTSIPISQYVLQLPQEMHMPGFTVIRYRPTF